MTQEVNIFSREETSPIKHPIWNNIQNYAWVSTEDSEMRLAFKLGHKRLLQCRSPIDRL